MKPEEIKVLTQEELEELLRTLEAMEAQRFGDQGGMPVIPFPPPEVDIAPSETSVQVRGNHEYH